MNEWLLALKHGMNLYTRAQNNKLNDMKKNKLKCWALIRHLKEWQR